MSDPNSQDDGTQQDQLNPYARDYDARFNDTKNTLQGAENSAASSDKKQLGSNGNSIDDQERNATASSAPSTIVNNYTGKDKLTAQGPWIRKRKGALTGIIVLLLGIMGIGTTLFTPGLGIVQMKEILTSDLNDQLAAMDIRGNAVFKAKLKSMSSGICTGVKIKCKFDSMSKSQIERFKKAGFIIADDGVKDTAFGRQKIISMIAPDGTVINNPADLTKARASSVEVRSALNRVFNPVYYGMADKVANTFFVKNKTSKQKKIIGADEEKRKNAITQATSGEKAQNGGVLKDSAGRNYLVNSEGVLVFEDTDKAAFDQLKQEADTKLAGLSEKEKVGGKALNTLLGATGTAVVGLGVLGIADNACSLYNTARAVSAAAKVARSMQLVQFAMVINGTADSIKAGDATPEETNLIGTMLTSTDSRKTIISETTGQSEDNPFYQKAAFDSPGYKTAAYNDAPTLTMQSQQYMVGGGLSGTLSNTLATIQQSIPGSPRDTCKIIQSPWVRGAGLVAGVFLAIGSFGITTAISASATIAIGFAAPFLEAALADIVAGSVVSGNTVGVEAGDAAFAGTAATLGGIAQGRGLAPLSSDGIKEYQTASVQSKNDMIAVEKYEAAKLPFDIMNQYSFLGSFARSLYPVSITAKTSVAGAVSSVGTVLTKGFASLMAPVSAAQPFNAERFEKCTDVGYEELGIDADIFCNVRYGLTNAELAMDTDTVVDFMLANNYIDGNGIAQGTYADYMKNCVNRVDGWGETSEENGSIGIECMDGNTSTYTDITYFRVYTIDATIGNAMDGDLLPDPEVPPAPEGEVTGGLVGEKAYPLPKDSAWASTYPGHRGIDFTIAAGTPIYAVADGTVIKTFTGCTNQNGGRGDSCGSYWGNHIKIRHADGTETQYAHIRSAADVLVKEGDAVKAGQHIGNVGSTGASTGSHLHFEVWQNGARIGDQGAFDWLKQYNILPRQQESLR